MNSNKILKINEETHKYFDGKKNENLSLFETIIGYDDIKKIFKMSLISDKPVHNLLVDEIEHMPYKDQTSLLSIMETGILTETKSQKTRSTQLKTWIFATCNNKEKLLSPLLSRFIIFHLKPYNRSKFIEVSNGILLKNDIPYEIANEISQVVWNKLKSKDIRD